MSPLEMAVMSTCRRSASPLLPAVFTLAVNEIIIVWPAQTGHRQQVVLFYGVCPRAQDPVWPPFSGHQSTQRLQSLLIQKRPENKPKWRPSMAVPPSSASGPWCPSPAGCLLGGSHRSDLGWGTGAGTGPGSTVRQSHCLTS